MNNILSSLPNYYSESNVMKNVTGVIDSKLEVTTDKVDKLNDELIISKSVDNLKSYEKQYGIKTDNDKNMIERRAVIQAKRMSKCTFTKKQVKKLCLAFVNDVEIIEHNEEFYFEINIILHGELPYTLDSLYKIIDDFKPAHLEVKYNLIINNNGKLKIGVANVNLETTTIYPQEVV